MISERLRLAVSKWRTDNGVPGVVAAVVHGDELSWSFADGLADQAPPRPMSEDAVFRTGSITKTFVAASILQLRDRGLVRLDEPLVDHLPLARAIQNPFGPITQIRLQDMLLHTSGLPREVPVVRLQDPIALADAEFHAVMSAIRLVRPPGTAHQYSNVAYRLLGYVIEHVTGMSLSEYLTVEILEPLGMRETAVSPIDELAARVTPGHWARDDCGVSLQHAPIDPLRTGGEGALYSTVTDLARWVAYQLQATTPDGCAAGSVLSKTSLVESHTPLVLANAAWTTAWGLGWSTVRRPGACIIHGHNGSFAGHQAYAGFCTEHRHGAVVLTNGHTRSRPTYDLCEELLGRTANRSETKEHVGDVAVHAGWRAYLGDYAWPQVGARIIVSLQNGRLYCSDQDGAYLLTERFGEMDGFTLADGPQAGEHVQFVRSEDQSVIGAIIGGYAYRRVQRTVPR